MTTTTATMFTIDFTLWDKSLQGKTNDAERQEILLYVERALNNTWRDYHNGEGVKVLERSWCGLTVAVADLDNTYWRDTPSLFVRRFMSRLHRLHKLYSGNDLFEVNWYWA